MFVTCVVAGRVIRICGGVSARGAQIRDIAFFAAALVLVAILGVRGSVGNATCGGVPVEGGRDRST